MIHARMMVDYIRLLMFRVPGDATRSAGASNRWRVFLHLHFMETNSGFSPGRSSSSNFLMLFQKSHLRLSKLFYVVERHLVLFLFLHESVNVFLNFMSPFFSHGVAIVALVIFAPLNGRQSLR